MVFGAKLDSSNSHSGIYFAVFVIDERKINLLIIMINTIETTGLIDDGLEFLQLVISSSLFSCFSIFFGLFACSNKHINNIH